VAGSSNVAVRRADKNLLTVEKHYDTNCYTGPWNWTESLEQPSKGNGHVAWNLECQECSEVRFFENNINGSSNI
jgi:hypothetical protein